MSVEIKVTRKDGTEVYQNISETQNKEVLTFKEIRTMTGLSQAAFAEKYEIPKRSIENWECNRYECPSYWLKLLERVVREDFQIK